MGMVQISIMFYNFVVLFWSDGFNKHIHLFQLYQFYIHFKSLTIFLISNLVYLYN